jgi:hypothetical protein
MRMSVSRIAGLTAALMISAAIVGCGGGGADVKSVVNTTTTGQQLIDLQKALDTGAITKEQYDQQKAKILKGH